MRKMCREGALSLFCFIIAGLISLFPELQFRLGFDIYVAYFTNIWLLHAVQYILINMSALLAFRGFAYQVAIRALFLGYIFGIGILVSINAPPSWQVFGIYTTVLASFHYTEFLAIAWSNPAALSIDSFILNHSIAYGIAACLSWMEFIIERHYFNLMKRPSFVCYFGLMLCISGEILRKLAMCTARHNFNHVVQNEKRNNHELVTHGVYNFCRHPSYVGWFYWSIGTQLILQNPLCLFAYALMSWSFFHDRVLIEEMTLLSFFGEDYVQYQRRVGTGLPFISGYKINS
ncbi:Protein-S-isoprenylcysteine O-methyltransferase [Atta colombica]|uniref:Protein-S-isoprenylcysteine O-methyltransferase n=1 Tax=Atta colombica TaxID=520822 RepID=A0A195AUC0_9HYME|nr:PREDICTED: protein-S-isoprenylcysteine O-methyltransferase [Atta colombica]KYM75833.1 Protein-S-isoprenylcysteine O-methyltransferase [Atta colombica]